MKTFNVVDLTKELISFHSDTSDTVECNKALQYTTTLLQDFNVKKYEKNGVKSLLFYTGTKIPKRFRVLLNAHLDVVPALTNQYNPIEKNGRIYGRGAQDMKSGAAAQILAFKEMAKQVSYPLGLQIVVDEEIGGFNGAKYQLQKGVLTDFVLAGESTNLRINNYAKGPVWLKLFVTGKSAHGAYAWNGSNAIDILRIVLNDLRKIYPEPTKEVWKTTLNIATVGTSNTAQNKVPSDATCTLDFRVIPEDRKTFMKDFKSIVGNRAKIEIMANEPCQITPNDHKDIVLLRKATKEVTGSLPEYLKTHGGSDVRFYTDAGSAAVCFGPTGDGLHTENEWVSIKSINDYYEILKLFLKSL